MVAAVNAAKTGWVNGLNADLIPVNPNHYSYFTSEDGIEVRDVRLPWSRCLGNISAVSSNSTVTRHD